MTTKTYMIQEREGGEWINCSQYDSRKEALCTISDILSNDEDADPQNFKIVEIETLQEFETLKEVADAICNDLSIFANEFEVGEICREFIEIEKKEKYPSWSSIELSRTMKVVDDFNKVLPQGYAVSWNINHQCMIRLFLMRPQDLKAQ